MIDDVDFPRHGEIFDGDNPVSFFFLISFRHALFGRMDTPKSWMTRSLIVAILSTSIVTLKAPDLVVALQMRLEERARSRIRKPQNQFFLFQFFQRDHAPAGKGVFVADRKTR